MVGKERLVHRFPVLRQGVGSMERAVLQRDSDGEGVNGVIVFPAVRAGIQFGNGIDPGFFEHDFAHLCLTAASEGDNIRISITVLWHRRVFFTPQQEGKLCFRRVLALHDFLNHGWFDFYRRNVSVENIKVVVAGGKARNRHLLDGIGDLAAVRAALWRSEGVVPLAAFVRGDGDFLHQQSPIFKPDGDRFGQHALVISAQRPRLFTLDFPLHFAHKNVGGGDSYRLTGKGSAVSVSHSQGVPVREVVVLPHFVGGARRDLKFLCFAGLEGKRGFHTIHKQSKVKFFVFVRFRVFARKLLGNREGNRFLRFVRRPILE